jgi:hemerythrin-like metal-binding protein
MEFVEWTEKHSVGNVLVDAYHHIFFQMVQEFRKVLVTHDQGQIEDCLKFLVDYTLMHFESEERLMEKAGYPDLESHKEVHQAFRHKMKEVHDRFLRSPESVGAEEVLFLLQKWFSEHILHTDMEFRPYLGQGSRPALEPHEY